MVKTGKNRLIKNITDGLEEVHFDGINFPRKSPNPYIRKKNGIQKKALGYLIAVQTTKKDKLIIRK